MEYLRKSSAMVISFTNLCLLCSIFCLLCPLHVGGQMMEEMEVPLLIRTVINKVDILLGKMEGMEVKVSGIEEKQKSTDEVLEDLKAKIVNVQMSCSQDEAELRDLLARDECSDGSHNCSAFANCEDKLVSYKCFCLPGYTGDGFNCSEAGCRSPFKDIEGVGCIHIVTEYKSFEKSRKQCQDLGGDIFVARSPEHYLRLAQYFVDTNHEAIEKYMWVGVTEGKWLSGRPVAPEEETPTNPLMEEGTCSYTDGDTDDEFLLYTHPCAISRGSICEWDPKKSY